MSLVLSFRQHFRGLTLQKLLLLIISFMRRQDYDPNIAFRGLNLRKLFLLISFMRTLILQGRALPYKCVFEIFLMLSLRRIITATNCAKTICTDISDEEGNFKRQTMMWKPGNLYEEGNVGLTMMMSFCTTDNDVLIFRQSGNWGGIGDGAQWGQCSGAVFPLLLPPPFIPSPPSSPSPHPSSLKGEVRRFIFICSKFLSAQN